MTEQFILDFKGFRIVTEKIYKDIYDRKSGKTSEVLTGQVNFQDFLYNSIHITSNYFVALDFLEILKAFVSNRLFAGEVYTCGTKNQLQIRIYTKAIKKNTDNTQSDKEEKEKNKVFLEFKIKDEKLCLQKVEAMQLIARFSKILNDCDYL